jgi:predicted AAA+ superfamily ATPase
MNKETIKKLIILAQEREVTLAKRDTQIYFSGKINTIIGSRRAGKTSMNAIFCQCRAKWSKKPYRSVMN